ASGGREAASADRCRTGAEGPWIRPAVRSQGGHERRGGAVDRQVIGAEAAEAAAEGGGAGVPPRPGAPAPWTARLPPRGPGGRGGAAVALGVLGAMALSALLAPVLAGHDPVATDTSATALPPGSPGHPLGTDQLGRDLLARMLYGARYSLAVGVAASAATVLLGTAVGALAAVAPRWLDTAVARTADALLALPMILVALTLAAVAGPSPATVVAAITVTGWMPVALIARAEVKALRGRPFVRAARSLGLTRTRIFLRHLVPNALPPIAAVAAFEVGH